MMAMHRFYYLLLFPFAVFADEPVEPFSFQTNDYVQLEQDIRSWWFTSDREKSIPLDVEDFLIGRLSDLRAPVTRSAQSSRDISIEILSRSDARVVPRMVELLKHADPLKRMAAIEILRYQGLKTDELIDQVLALSSDPDSRVVGEVATSLVACTNQIDKAILVGIKLLEMEGTVQGRAAGALGSIALNAPDDQRRKITWRLIELSGSNNGFVSRWSLSSLQSLMSTFSMPEQEAFVVRLLPLLAPDNRYLQRVAATIASVGTAGRSAIPRFKQVMKTMDEEDRVSFAVSLWHVEQEPDEVFAVFKQALKSKDRMVQYYGFRGLSAMGEQAIDALPEVTRFLNGPDRSDRVRALKCIGAMGPVAGKALPLVERSLQSNDAYEMNAARAAREAIEVL